MTIAAEKDFVAIGVLAARLQKSVRTIEQAANELGISPALRLNMIAHFDGEQTERLTQALNTKGNR